MARRRMCHEPGQHAPPTTETYTPGKEGTETTQVSVRLNSVELNLPQSWLEVAEPGDRCSSFTCRDARAHARPLTWRRVRLKLAGVAKSGSIGR